MHLSRRAWLTLAGSGSFGLAVDWERLLWKPGARAYGFMPQHSLIAFSTLDATGYVFHRGTLSARLKGNSFCLVGPDPVITMTHDVGGLHKIIYEVPLPGLGVVPCRVVIDDHRRILKDDTLTLSYPNERALVTVNPDYLEHLPFSPF